MVFREYSPEMESLLGLFDHVVGVGSPGEILCDVCAKELEDSNPLHTFLVNLFHVCFFSYDSP